MPIQRQAAEAIAPRHFPSHAAWLRYTDAFRQLRMQVRSTRADLLRSGAFHAELASLLAAAAPLAD